MGTIYQCFVSEKKILVNASRKEVLVGSYNPVNSDSYWPGFNVRQRSFDIKAAIPEIYTSLTKDDFVVRQNGSCWMRAYGGLYGAASLPWPTIGSYNASTGTVTVINTTTVNTSIPDQGSKDFVCCYGIQVFALISA